MSLNWTRNEAKKNIKEEEPRGDSRERDKQNKSARWMPRLPEAKKDVTSDETPGVGASDR